MLKHEKADCDKEHEEYGKKYAGLNSEALKPDTPASIIIQELDMLILEDAAEEYEKAEKNKPKIKEEIKGE